MNIADSNRPNLSYRFHTVTISYESRRGVWEAQMVLYPSWWSFLSLSLGQRSQNELV